MQRGTNARAHRRRRRDTQQSDLRFESSERLEHFLKWRGKMQGKKIRPAASAIAFRLFIAKASRQVTEAAKHEPKKRTSPSNGSVQPEF